MSAEQREFYLKGIYPVEVVSEAKDGVVEVRAKTTFLHTSAYSDKKRWVRRGEILQVPSVIVWSQKRSIKIKCTTKPARHPASYDSIFRKRYNRSHIKICHKCNKSFVEGDEIHVQNNRSNVRIYHKACWDAMFI